MKKKSRLFSTMTVAALSLSLVLSGCSGAFSNKSASGSTQKSTSSASSTSASSANSSSSSKSSQSASQSPDVIKVGTLYAKSGSYATSSMPEYKGLQFWAHEVNTNGGIQLKSGKKAKIKIIAYNDQSSTQTATNLYNQLITKDKVNIFIADFGSVLTSVAVPIAKEHKQLLFDQSGTGANFFKDNNPYIVLTSLQTSSLWPGSLADYIINNKIKNVAVVYNSNDFDQSQDETLTTKLKAAGITPVYNQAVPTSTSNYTVLLNNIAAKHPDMVIEFGYPNNDIAFLQAYQSGNHKFKKVFTIFPGQLPQLFIKNVGKKGIANTYTYPTPPLISRDNVNYGMKLNEFETAFKKWDGNDINFLNVAGYHTGLIVQKTLETATSLNQLDLRDAVTQFSGKLNTLDGNFTIDSHGAQTGEALPVGQWTLDSSGNLKMVVKK